MRFLPTIILYTLFSILYTLPAAAYQMQDSQFSIESDDTSIFPNKLSPSPTPLSPETAEKKTTILYPKSEKKTADFSLSVNDLLIDFGELEPTNPIIRTTTIIIRNNLLPAYSLLAWENHSPVETNGITIADTSCDNGSCTETQAATWDSPLTYGFGYRCDNIRGKDCNASFAERNRFRKFANRSTKSREQSIMSGNRTQAESEITYKVNIPPSQLLAEYTNTVTYLLVPGF